ncbi:uncharacterized protein MKK02DRAFT_39569 [Dioszegia hungarica]|uniref:Uncharacterized protein n=1 Tax=Dioszegia hungarica TaxID=4972 RepID=A0AA38HEN2_9TREE|nr:uncharacterized protein MKK02DRAFT_39569 [Dioszegia hungarica]KAI9639273.1 hypothetical protein MKK02DRAFT_39569 [Dioszegia hungarica]
MSSVSIQDLDASPDEAQGCIILWKAILLTYGVFGSIFLITVFVLIIIIETWRYWRLRAQAKGHIGTMRSDLEALRKKMRVKIKPRRGRKPSKAEQ